MLHYIDGRYFATELDQPGHRLHKAWKELQRPSDEHSRRSWFVSRKSIAELLATIRTHYPGLEQRLDWHRVTLWEHKSGFGKVWLWAIAIAVMTLPRLYNHVPDLPRTETPKNRAPLPLDMLGGTLTDPRSDIDSLIQATFEGKIKATDLEARDPRLVSDLTENWKIAKDNGSQLQDFLLTGRALLLTRMRQNLIEASYPVLAEHYRLTIEETGSIRRTGGEAMCVAAFNGRQVSINMPTDLYARRKVLTHRILLEAAAGKFEVREPENSYFDISKSIAGQVLLETRLSREQVLEAFAGKGSNATQCDVRQALWRAVLALPEAEGLRMMRAMQGKNGP